MNPPTHADDAARLRADLIEARTLLTEADEAVADLRRQLANLRAFIEWQAQAQDAMARCQAQAHDAMARHLAGLQLAVRAAGRN